MDAESDAELIWAKPGDQAPILAVVTTRGFEGVDSRWTVSMWRLKMGLRSRSYVPDGVRGWAAV